jgi:hypothetical protein
VHTLCLDHDRRFLLYLHFLIHGQNHIVASFLALGSTSRANRIFMSLCSAPLVLFSFLLCSSLPLLPSLQHTLSCRPLSFFGSFPRRFYRRYILPGPLCGPDDVRIFSVILLSLSTQDYWTLLHSHAHAKPVLIYLSHVPTASSVIKLHITNICLLFCFVQHHQRLRCRSVGL